MSDISVSAMPTVRDCVERIKRGQLTSEQLVGDCLALIDRSEAEIGAWAHVDAEHALNQARSMDELRRRGRPMGVLHGIPIALKDVIDTVDMPTQRGTAIYRDRKPDADAAVVEKLREAGAIILGKTVTTELAWMHPAGTHNPHNPNYSPGGSSSGSAAAVAAGHVPLALGTQTGGSVIRPASFCGVYGFKPSRGVIPRRGVLQTSPTLDQVGVFGRNIEDIAQLCDVIKGFDSSDPLSYLAPRPEMLNGYLAEVPVVPNLVWVDLPYASRFSAAVNDAFRELREALVESAGNCLDRIEAPRSFATLIACHRVIYDVEILRCLDYEWQHHRESLSDTAREGLERAAARSQDEYDEALGIMAGAKKWFETFFHDYDAILTPSATGIPPRYGDGTGDPICCLIWTLCGLPCLNLPMLTGEHNLPIGAQLVGSHEQDDRLLRTARWLLYTLKSGDAPLASAQGTPA